jgi:hypothetical protein
MTTTRLVLSIVALAATAALAPEPDPPLAGPAIAGAQAAAFLDGVVLQSREGSTVVEIRTSGPTAYHATQVDAPPRIVVDLPAATYAWRGAPLKGGGDPVREVRGTQPRPGAAQVVIELARIADYRVAAARDGLRVIIEGPAVARPEPAAPSADRVVATWPLLHGVVRGPRGWVAYIQHAPGDSLSGYRVGDTVGPHIVEAIDADRVVLRGPEGRIVLRLRDEASDAGLKGQR